MSDALPQFQHEEGRSHRLLEQAKAAGGDHMTERHDKIVNGPAPMFQNAALAGSGLKASNDVKTSKAAFEKNDGLMCAMLNEISRKTDGQTNDGNLYLLTMLYDILREDSSCYDFFEKNGLPIRDNIKGLATLVEWKGTDPYLADKAAWVLTAILGHIPKVESVKDVVSWIMNPESVRTELGKVEALTNLMKSDRYRGEVWDTPGVHDLILSIDKDSIQGPTIYRRVFAIWLLSFDRQIADTLQTYNVAEKLKEILKASRVEKVVRLTLTVLKNLLNHKSQCESIVEADLLDVVQQLEYEKWRDSELYDSIREVAQQITHEVSELSNFDRYQTELATGRLSWGFIHSNKFWQENVKKFEANNFKAIKDLVALLYVENQNEITLAVACHDIGEFVSLHPAGKKLPIMVRAKERVMGLMTSNDNNLREVRREALLCCQKIMLNKWQDVKTVDAAK